MRNMPKISIYICFLLLLASVPLGLFSATPVFAFQQKITELHTVKGVEVVVQYHGGIHWRMSVANGDSRESISILWDKSFYTSSSGRKSRLIRQKNKNIHPRAKQRSSKVLPSQKVVKIFTCEDLLPYASSGVPQPSDPSSPGRLSIALSKNGRKFIWIGTVAFVD